MGDNSSMSSSILVFAVIGLALVIFAAKSRIGQKDDEGFKKVTTKKCSSFVFKKYKEDEAIATKDDFEKI